MRRVATVVVTALMCSSPGCFFSGNDAGPAPVYISKGTLTVDWTIINSADPNQCNQGVAADIDIAVTAPDGAPIDEFRQRCSDGVATIMLDAGSYAAQAALLDSADHERTTWVSMNPFIVENNTDLPISGDFPASSFY